MKDRADTLGRAVVGHDLRQMFREAIANEAKDHNISERRTDRSEKCREDDRVQRGDLPECHNGRRSREYRSEKESGNKTTDILAVTGGDKQLGESASLHQKHGKNNTSG